MGCREQGPARVRGRRGARMFCGRAKWRWGCEADVHDHGWHGGLCWRLGERPRPGNRLSDTGREGCRIRELDRRADRAWSRLRHDTADAEWRIAEDGASAEWGKA